MHCRTTPVLAVPSGAMVKVAGLLHHCGGAYLACVIAVLRVGAGCYCPSIRSFDIVEDCSSILGWLHNAARNLTSVVLACSAMLAREDLA